MREVILEQADQYEIIPIKILTVSVEANQSAANIVIANSKCPPIDIVICQSDKSYATSRQYNLSLKYDLEKSLSTLRIKNITN